MTLVVYRQWDANRSIQHHKQIDAATLQFESIVDRLVTNTQVFKHFYDKQHLLKQRGCQHQLKQRGSLLGSCDSMFESIRFKFQCISSSYFCFSQLCQCLTRKQCHGLHCSQRWIGFSIECIQTSSKSSNKSNWGLRWALVCGNCWKVRKYKEAPKSGQWSRRKETPRNSQWRRRKEAPRSCQRRRHKEASIRSQWSSQWRKRKRAPKSCQWRRCKKASRV